MFGPTHNAFKSRRAQHKKAELPAGICRSTKNLIQFKRRIYLHFFSFLKIYTYLMYLYALRDFGKDVN